MSDFARMRYTLTKEDLEQLLRGGTIEFLYAEADACTPYTVEVNLEDIGYEQIKQMIIEAVTRPPLNSYHVVL